MHNAARDLGILFETWNSREGNASQQIRLDTVDGWSELHRAFVLLDDIELSLRVLKDRRHDVDAYFEVLPEWRTSVTHYPHSWLNERLALRESRSLRMLAPILDSVNHDPETLNPALRQVLEDTLKTVREDQSLDDVLKRYTAKLIRHIQSLLDAEEAGHPFDLAESLAHLKIYMDAAAHQSSSSKLKKVYRTASQFFRHPYIASTGAALSVGLAQNALGT